MSDPKRVQPGEPIRHRASDHNAFVETWRKVQNLVPPKNSPGNASGAGRLTALVQNMTGADIDADFPVLALGEPFFTPADRDSIRFEEGIVFKGTTPGADTTIGDIAVIQGPINEGGPRPGVRQGPTYCLIDVTDAAHTHATPKSGDSTQLQSDTSGAKILWRETGTGSKKALVMLGAGGDDEEHYVLVTISTVPAAADATTPGVLTALAGAGGGSIGIFKVLGDNDYEEVLDGASVSILNPFLYDAFTGVYPIKRVDSNTFIIDGFDARGHTNWLAGSDQVFVHYAGQMPQWEEDLSIFEGPAGPQGDPGPAGADGEDGANPVEGYAIDVEAPSTVHFDPTEITGFAATFQIFMHDSAAANRDDPDWRTVTTYDNTKTQLLGQINGVWHAKTIVEWLELVDGYAAGSDQILGHTAAGEIEWKTITSKVINSVTGFGLNLDADSLDGNVNYTPVTVKVWPAASDGGGASFDDTVPVDDCTA